MKEIRIRKQPRLGFMRTALITLNGIRYRLFRSIVTMIVITVAVAFLMNILSESLIKREVALSTASRIAKFRLAPAWVTRLQQPPTAETILERLAGLEGADRQREVARMSGGAASTGEGLAARALTYLRFFRDLDYGRRRLVAGRSEGVATFDYLLVPENQEKLQRTLTEVKSLKFPGELDDLQAFLGQWPDLRSHLARVRQGYATAAASIQKIEPSKPMLEKLMGADGEFGESLREAGYVLPDDEAKLLSAQAGGTLDSLALEKEMQLPAMRTAVAAKLDLLPSEVKGQTVWELLDKSDSVSWFLSTLQPITPIPEGWTNEYLMDLADRKKEERSLANADTGDAGQVGERFGLGERMRWLLLVSLMVCAVGIANAMLMSVTERYREIATLKCLGALDGSIMLIFIMEAALLGFAGGLAGAIAGALTGTLRMLAAYGSLLSGAVPVFEIAAAMAITTIIGIVLGALASIYPSWKAARLAPMEAMRIE